jgi:hypothetical protein
MPSCPPCDTGVSAIVSAKGAIMAPFLKSSVISEGSHNRSLLVFLCHKARADLRMSNVIRLETREDHGSSIEAFRLRDLRIHQNPKMRRSHQGPSRSEDSSESEDEKISSEIFEHRAGLVLSSFIECKKSIRICNIFY